MIVAAGSRDFVSIWIPDPASPKGFQASLGYAPTSAATSTSLILKKADFERYWMNVCAVGSGVQFLTRSELLGMTENEWIPACAGMTELG
jgi:hypothetical protein